MKSYPDYPDELDDYDGSYCNYNDSDEDDCWDLPKLPKKTQSAVKPIIGLAGIPGLAQKSAMILERYSVAVKNSETPPSPIRIHELIDRIEKSIKAAQPKNFGKKTALSLISTSITELYKQETPKDFEAAIQVLEFFVKRLCLACEKSLKVDELAFLRDACQKISTDTSPFVRRRM